MRIIGLTGTDFRGITPIIGDKEPYFWRKKIIDIPQEYLTHIGYLVPYEFGFSSNETHYDLSEFHSNGNDGIQDFTAAQLHEMEKLILKAETTTEKIIIEVVEKTKNRNCVMITGAGKKHLKEAARFLPKGSYAIITDDVPAKKRQKLLKQAFDGHIKFLLQVGCLTTGLNIPLIDTIVILRKIGSLTLLTQLIGRGLRLLKDFQIEKGIIKDNCLVLDYSDTMTELRESYENPILEAADFSKSKQENQCIICPKCGSENGMHAVRCRGIDFNGARCDFFFKSRTCDPFYVNGRLVNSGCGAENAPTARNCRICSNTLIDPNDNLNGKHYKDTDYKPVLKFSITATKNSNGIIVKYQLPGNEVASVVYTPFSGNKVAKRIFYNNFVKNHCKNNSMSSVVMSAKHPQDIINSTEQLNTIAAITHRLNNKNESVITKYITKAEYNKLNENKGTNSENKSI